MKHLATSLLITTCLIGMGSVGNALANGKDDDDWDDRKGHPGLRFMVKQHQAAIHFGEHRPHRSDRIKPWFRRGSVDVNCRDDANAFRNIEIEANTTYVLSGMCNGPIWIEEDNNVTIEGDGDGIKDDGVVLPADLTEYPNAAIVVWQSTGIDLDNLTYRPPTTSARAIRSVKTSPP